MSEKRTAPEYQEYAATVLANMNFRSISIFTSSLLGKFNRRWHQSSNFTACSVLKKKVNLAIYT